MSGVVRGLVQPLVAARTGTVVYDRAGIGRSDRAAGPRTLDALAADLGVLLRDLGPVVLVGHSWGGPIVRVAAAAAGDSVRAIVLVDPSDEHDPTLRTAAARRRFALAGPVTRALAAVGVYRCMSGMGDVLPEGLRARFCAEDFGRRAARQLADEVRHFLPGLARLRASPVDLGAVPVTILTAGREHPEAHDATVAARPTVRHVVVPDGSHALLLERPDLVAAEILRLL